jgi:hypothetical protein
MTLYSRKLAEQAIQDSRSQNDPMLPATWYEERFLHYAERADEDPAAACGGMTVIIADLLEKVRRNDPAYGLAPIPGGRPYGGE